MSRRKQPNPNKVNPVMDSSEEPRDTPLQESPAPKPLNHHEVLNGAAMNGASSSEENLPNGEAEPMETDAAPRPDADLSSINDMMSAVMSSAVMSSAAMTSSTTNGADEEAETELSASSSAAPSPSPSPTKSLTSAMRAPPSRNQRRTQDSKDDSNAFVCPLCDKNCGTQHQLTMHIRQHNTEAGATDHSCSICGKCLSSASSLDRHMLVHSGERPYKCSVCGQTFTTNGNMHRHMKIHEKDPVSGLVLLSPPSPSPSKRRRPPSVKRRLTEESDEPPNKKVVEEAALDDSAAPVRAVEEELSCPICFTVLSSRLELDEHMDTHPDTALRCDTCCLTFRTHRGLLRHNAGVHQLLPLDPSGRPFIQSNPSIPSGFNELAFIDFSCSKFSHIAQVWCETNLRRCLSKIHRFVCDLCDRAFPLRSALDLHKTRSHQDPPGGAPGGDRAPGGAPAGGAPAGGAPAGGAPGGDRAPVAERAPGSEASKPKPLQQGEEEEEEEEDEEEHSEQEGFLQSLGLKLKSKIPAGPSEAELVQARLDSIKTIPVDSSSVHMEALSLGLTLGVPLFQTSFLLQSEGGATGSEAPPLMELADLQHILQAAAAAPNQIALSMKGGAAGSAQRPPMKPRPQPAARCGLASTPPPPQPASLGCISPSLPPPTPLFKSLSQTDPESPSPSVTPPSVSPPDGAALPHTSLSPDDSAALRKPRPQPKGSFSCRFCAQVFPHSALLQSHLRSHLGVVPHQCNICEYVAPDKATLIRHLRTHSGERPYVCRVCHYPFTVKANCERHLRKKHNKTSRKDIEKNIKYVTSTATNNITAALTAAAANVAKTQAEEADAVCRFCGDDLKSYRSLQIHLRAHSGCQRKPFECRRCGAAFLAKRNCIHHLLKQHPEIQERDIDAHIHTLQPANATGANATGANATGANATGANATGANATGATATVANVSTRALNGVKAEPGFPADLDQPLDFSAKSRGGVKLEFCDATAASDEPIDLSVPSKRPRREEPEVKQEREDKAAPVLTCFLPNPAPTGLSPAPSCLRPARLKPLLPKPAASSELPPLASIAQIISSVSTATDLLRREAVGTTTTTAGGGATEPRAEPERETTHDDEDAARKRPRKKPAPKAAVELESGADLASVEKMLANTDANKFSPFLQSAQAATPTQSSVAAVTKKDGAEEKPAPREESKPAPPKGKKNAYSNSAQKMTCPFCPRVFPWASSLQRHMLTHTGQKPFPCPKCDAFFSTKSNCERHLLRKHGVTNRTLRRNGAVVKKEEDASHESAESQSEAEPSQVEMDPKNAEMSPAPNTSPVQSESQGEEPASENPAHSPEQDTVLSEVASASQSEASEPPQEAPESSSSSRSSSSSEKMSGATKAESSADDDDCHSNKSLDLNFGRKLIDFKLGAAPGGSSQDEQPHANDANDGSDGSDANPDKPEFKHVCRICHKSFRYGTTLARHEKAHDGEEAELAGEEAEPASEDEKAEDKAAAEEEEGEEFQSEGDSGESDFEERERDEAEDEEEPSDDSGEGRGDSEGRGDGEGRDRADGGGGRVDKRKKICNVCGKRFWSLQDLTRHMRSHTGERPYQCSTCERTFTLKHSLVRHQRIHLKPRSEDLSDEPRSQEAGEAVCITQEAGEEAGDTVCIPPEAGDTTCIPQEPGDIPQEAGDTTCIPPEAGDTTCIPQEPGDIPQEAGEEAGDTTCIPPEAGDTTCIPQEPGDIPQEAGEEAGDTVCIPPEAGDTTCIPQEPGDIPQEAAEEAGDTTCIPPEADDTTCTPPEAGDTTCIPQEAVCTPPEAGDIPQEAGDTTCIPQETSDTVCIPQETSDTVCIPQETSQSSNETSVQEAPANEEEASSEEGPTSTPTEAEAGGEEPQKTSEPDAKPAPETADKSPESVETTLENAEKDAESGAEIANTNPESAEAPPEEKREGNAVEGGAPEAATETGGSAADRAQAEGLEAGQMPPEEPPALEPSAE